MSLLDDLADDLASSHSLQRWTKEKKQALLFCTRCGSHKAASAFSPDIRRKNKHQGWCKECHRTQYTAEEKQVQFWNSRAVSMRIEGRISLKLWLDLKEAYGGRCAYCGLMTDNLSPDHYYPACWAREPGYKSSLTTGWIENCRPACRMCNMAKSNMDPLEFIEWLDGVAARRLKGLSEHNGGRLGEVDRKMGTEEPPREASAEVVAAPGAPHLAEDNLHRHPQGQPTGYSHTSAELEWLRAEA